VAVAVMLVKDGLEETAMVEVPESRMLLPAVNREAMSENTGIPVPPLLKTWNIVPGLLKLKADPVLKATAPALPAVVVPVPPWATGTEPEEVRFLAASVKTKELAVKVATFRLPW